MDWVDYGIPHTKSKPPSHGYRANVQPLKLNVWFSNSCGQSTRAPEKLEHFHDWCNRCVSPGLKALPSKYCNTGLKGPFFHRNPVYQL
jgi:hypothetical protein